MTHRVTSNCFSGSVALLFLPRPRLRICLIGDAANLFEVNKDKSLIGKVNLADFLTKSNKDKKLFKIWAKKIHLFRD